jgi:hypothetical protein
MARCVVTVDGFARVRELLPSTLVGRSARCDVVVTGHDIPAYWLEVRWLGTEWAWRELVPLDTLRSAGDPLPNGWHALRTSGPARGTRLRWNVSGTDSLELIDASPPTPLVVDLCANEPSAEGLALVERRVDGDFLLDEDAQPLRAVSPDEVFVARGRAWRFVHPGPLRDTVRLSLSLAHPEATLATAPGCAELRIGNRLARIEGEFARTLHVYAVARRADPRPEGGWLGVREAFEAWLGCGGLASSPPDRLGWDRGKVRTALAEAGVAGASDLFEVSRVEGVSRCRVSLPADRLAAL